MTRRKLQVVAVGMALGLALGFFLPRSWVFVETHAAHHEHGGEGKYACPMFCVVMDHLTEDGKCPVCGMTLTEISGESRLDESERRMVGLEVHRLSRMPLARSIRSVGEVDYDETRLARITTRTSGWLEKVWVETTWMPVGQDDKLATIYSPELYAAQREYLVAGDTLRESSRLRLRLLGVSDTEIAELQRSGTVRESVVIRSPRSGIVVERNAVEGASVKKGELLYTVADLDRVWVQAEMFERDLVWISDGQPARLELEGRAEPLVGRVAFVDPVIDRATRTARARIEVVNAPGAGGVRPLRVGQRVEVWLEARLGENGAPVAPGADVKRDPLAIPVEAVLSTGKRKVAYVLFTEESGGRDYGLDPKALPEQVFYEMVEIRVGPLARSGGGDYYPVLAGPLRLDMVVVTKGNLLLDSQAQLSGKPSLLFPEGSRGAGDDPHAGH